MACILVELGSLLESFDIPSSIQDLKQAIDEAHGVGPSKQVLLIDGVEASDPSSLVEGSTVTLLRLVEVTIQNPDGICLTLTVPLEYHVADLVDQIRETELGKAYDNHLILLFRDEERLRGPRTLESYGLTDSCQLQMVQGPNLGRSLMAVPHSSLPARLRDLARWKKPRRASDIVAAEVEVCKAWDGGINKPWAGLRLVEGSTVFVLYMMTPDWCYGRVGGNGPEGLFPRAFVQTINVLLSDFPIGEDIDPPPIPPPSPSAPGALSNELFDPDSIPLDDGPIMLPRFHLADKGDSFVVLEFASRRPLPSSGDSPRIEVLIKCCPVPPRRITSVVLELNFRGNYVTEVSPEKMRGPQTEARTEFVTRGAAAVTAGASVSSAAFSVTFSREIARTTEATRKTQGEIDGVALGQSVRWTLREDGGQAGRNGIPEQTLSAWLRYPARLVEYHCLIAHAENIGSATSRTKTFDGHLRFPTEW